MRHKVYKKKFNRDHDHRHALMTNLAVALIDKEKLTTTEAKAKAVKRVVEKMIGKAKTNSVHVRRQLISELSSKDMAHKLVDVLGPRYESLPGGWIEAVRVGRRKGDNTVMVRLTLRTIEENKKEIVKEV